MVSEIEIEMNEGVCILFTPFFVDEGENLR